MLGLCGRSHCLDAPGSDFGLSRELWSYFRRLDLPALVQRLGSFNFQRQFAKLMCSCHIKERDGNQWDENCTYERCRQQEIEEENAHDEQDPHHEEADKHPDVG